MRKIKIQDQARLFRLTGSMFEGADGSMKLELMDSGNRPLGIGIVTTVQPSGRSQFSESRKFMVWPEEEIPVFNRWVAKVQRVPDFPKHFHEFWHDMDSVSPGARNTDGHVAIGWQFEALQKLFTVFQNGTITEHVGASHIPIITRHYSIMSKSSAEMKFLEKMAGTFYLFNNYVLNGKGFC